MIGKRCPLIRAESRGQRAEGKVQDAGFRLGTVAVTQLESVYGYRLWIKSKQRNRITTDEWQLDASNR